jgi:hypothetical protein
MVNKHLADIYDLEANNLVFKMAGHGNFTQNYMVGIFRYEWEDTIRVDVNHLCSELSKYFKGLDDIFYTNIAMVLGNNIYRYSEGYMVPDYIWVKLKKIYFHHDNWGRDVKETSFQSIEEFLNDMKNDISSYVYDPTYNYKFDKDMIKNSFKSLFESPEYINFKRTRLIDDMTK